MPWYTPIVSFFKSVGVKVSALLVAVFGRETAQQLGDVAIEALKTSLGVIVMDAVVLVQSLQIGSEAKRAEAFKKIVADASRLGITFSHSLVNLLIELAVQRLKGTIEPVDPTVVPVDRARYSRT